MNERIKELAEQAGFMHSWFSESGDDCERELKKFAELIVAECALLCISRPSPGDDVRSREHCAEQIREHFGVKE
jgi:hypothetical protein